MGLLGGVAAICDVWLGWPLPLTIIVTLVLGLLLGAWNGWWVAYRKVPSFIVTLAGMLAFRGILIGITNGTTVSPTSAAMSQIGQSYLPASTGFIIGALGLMAFVGWQWRGRMRRQALGLQSPASTAVVGRQALTAIIVLGAIWLLNDYRGVPTPVLLLTLLLLGGMFMATRTAFELAMQLGVSRNSLREALAKLVSEGVLLSRRGGGTFIRWRHDTWSEQNIVQPLKTLMADDRCKPGFSRIGP